jgi:hypothetical protein
MTALVAASVHAQATITYLGVNTNATDYSITGLNIGKRGFWFPQFDAAAPITGAAVDDNDRNSLPSWVLPNFANDQSFANNAFSEGGDVAWATLTLPDGTSGLSGALVDPGTASNSNNSIQELLLGPGTPSSFTFHIVVDNTNGEHDPASRLRARGEDPSVPFDITADIGNVPPGLATNMDGLPDVYSFQYDGFDSGNAFIKFQLNSGSANAAGIGGIMFDAIPEPASIAMMIVGAAGLGVAVHRRRHAR